VLIDEIEESCSKHGINNECIKMKESERERERERVRKT
jgi:hypothetical protein